MKKLFRLKKLKNVGEKRRWKYKLISFQSEIFEQKSIHFIRKKISSLSRLLASGKPKVQNYLWIFKIVHVVITFQKNTCNQPQCILWRWNVSLFSTNLQWWSLQRGVKRGIWWSAFSCIRFVWIEVRILSFTLEVFDGFFVIQYMIANSFITDKHHHQWGEGDTCVSSNVNIAFWSTVFMLVHHFLIVSLLKSPLTFDHFSVQKSSTVKRSNVNEVPGERRIKWWTSMQTVFRIRYF